jgi:heat shock protein HslJ
MNRLTGSKSMLMGAVALVALLIAACAPITPEPPADATAPEATATPAPEGEATTAETAPLTLEGVDWQLAEFVGADGTLTAAVADVDATLTFADGTVSGSAGCNRFSAGYTLTDAAISIEQGMSTMMACEEPIMAQEQAVLDNLAQAASFEIVDGELHLLDADGNVLLAFTQLEAASLTGVTWVATNFNNGNEAVVGVLEDTELTLVFGEDGSLSGTAGCNNLMSGYTVSGNEITIEPAASTRMMCAEPAGIMEQEAAFLMALQTAATFTIQGDVLEMRTADDAMVGRFVAN